LYVCGKIKNIRAARPHSCTLDDIADFGDRVFALQERSIFTESARLKLAKQTSRRERYCFYPGFGLPNASGSPRSKSARRAAFDWKN
jgi:hypothetical protein